MSPTLRGKHAGVVKRLWRQLEVAVPEGLDMYEVSSIALPEDADVYVTPDLVVLPAEWEEDDDWLASPEDAALAVEVIPSRRSPAKSGTRPTGTRSLVSPCSSSSTLARARGPCTPTRTTAPTGMYLWGSSGSLCGCHSRGTSRF
ncbi:hypothetical protein [Streptomyces sp. NPDC047706]|uniref:hypothetical protein n=1 Tax=Streptomyces sp. NPDC047706 TaxID=3365486 RepID=UPI003724410C